MKVWMEYGTEHSANLVMIGTFSDDAKAAKAEEAFKRIQQQAIADEASGELPVAEGISRFTDGMLNLLKQLDVWGLSSSDPETFVYEYGLKRDDATIEIQTDETEVGGFLRLMLEYDAKIEIYSRHVFND